MRVQVVLLFVLVASAGCVQSAKLVGADAPETMVITGQGSRSGAQERGIDCPDSATLSVVLQGRGDVVVAVEDAAGTRVHEGRYQDSQNVEVGTLGGAPGPWTVRVDFAMADVLGQRFGAYEGSWAITFVC